MPEVLASAVTQEKEVNRHTDWKGVKLPLFADGMIMDTENPKGI